MATHSRYSPSAAPRWLRCPGSVPLNEAAEDKPSKYAAEGSAAHWLGEMMLRRGLSAESAAALYKGERVEFDGYNVEITQDMLDHVAGYAEFVRERWLGNVYMLESRVDFSRYVGLDPHEATGTADAIIIDGSLLQVIDLKYGFSPVEAENNEQLMLYALGALELCAGIVDVTHVNCVIYQPRGGGVRVASCRVEELEAFAARAKEAVRAVESGDTSLRPSDTACKWCRVAATCPALARQVEQAVVANFDDLTLPDVAQYQEGELSRALSVVDLVEQWVAAVRAEAHNRLARGEPVKGYKLVAGRRGNRAWADEPSAAGLLGLLLGEAAYVKKLISPAQAEKLAGAKQCKNLLPETTQSEGNPIVVAQSDPRPTLASTVDLMPLLDHG